MQKETITLCVLICLSSQANVTSQKSISIRMTEISYYISMISAGIISKNNTSSVSIKIFYIFVANPLDEEGIQNFNHA